MLKKFFFSAFAFQGGHSANMVTSRLVVAADVVPVVAVVAADVVDVLQSRLLWPRIRFGFCDVINGRCHHSKLLSLPLQVEMSPFWMEGKSSGFQMCMCVWVWVCVCLRVQMCVTEKK